jgi:hypothetical protein
VAFFGDETKKITEENLVLTQHQFGSGPNYLNGVIVTEYKYG